MKKLILTVLTILSCSAAYALPIGNPSEASLLCDGVCFPGMCYDFCEPGVNLCDAFSLRTGFYGDYVFNRHLEIDTNEDDSNIEHTKIFTNAAFLAANVWNRLDLFAALGATNLLLDTNASAFTGIPGERFVVETETDFSYGIGLRATILECGCTSLGAEAQYFHTRPNVRRVTSGSAVSAYPDNQIDAKYHEWQIGVGIAHRINMFVPYIAVKWSRAKLNFDHALIDFATPGVPLSQLFNLDNDKNIGFAVGVSLVDCEKAAVTAEVRFGDEKAAYVNGQFRF
jgi:major outer membrane protein